MTAPTSSRLADLTLVGLAVIAVALAGASYAWPRVGGSKEVLSAPLELVELVHQRLPPVTVRHVDGTVAPYDPAANGRATILLVFRSTCPVCEANSPSWARLVGKTRSNARVIAVATEPLEPGRAWVQRHSLPVDDVIALDGDGLARWHLTRVPTTVLTDKDGHVLEALVGPLRDSDIDVLVSKARGS